MAFKIYPVGKRETKQSGQGPRIEGDWVKAGGSMHLYWETTDGLAG